MKSQIASTVVTSVFAMAISSSCNTPAPKDEKYYSDTLQEPITGVDTPMQFRMEWGKFKRESEQTIQEYTDSMDEVQARM